MLAATTARCKPMRTTTFIQSTLRVPLWRRLAALAYDLLAVLAVTMVTVMLCLLITRGHLHADATWYRLTLFAAVAAYFLLSWVRGGQTLGMRPWRIHVCTSAGNRPGIGRATARFAVAATPLSLLELGHVWPAGMTLLAPIFAWTAFFAVALLDPRRRALHDLLTGTELRRRA